MDAARMHARKPGAHYDQIRAADPPPCRNAPAVLAAFGAPASASARAGTEGVDNPLRSKGGTPPRNRILECIRLEFSPAAQDTPFTAPKPEAAVKPETPQSGGTPRPARPGRGDAE